jgi:hypothetical protein
LSAEADVSAAHRGGGLGPPRGGTADKPIWSVSSAGGSWATGAASAQPGCSVRYSLSGITAQGRLACSSDGAIRIQVKIFDTTVL